MLRLFQSIFGGGEQPGRYSESLVEMAIERAVDGTDPRIRALPGYRKRLRVPVLHAIDHLLSLALARIIDIKREHTELKRKRAVLKRKLAALQKIGWGFDATEGSPTDAGAVERDLARTQAQILRWVWRRTPFAPT